jgi:glyoxylase-like metal-dependent hydrolase (beta-lactamase superfamily II)
MDTPTYGRIEPVSALVRRLLAHNPSPFTHTGTQTYVVGHGEVALIDPGPDLEEHVHALLRVLEGEEVRAILCTHTHRDHSPASRAVAAATGAPIVGCAPVAIADDGPRADEAFDSDYRPHRILRDGERITGPGWTLEAVATPGHTSNHLAFALIEEQALFSGDHVMGWSTTVVAPPDGDMADYMASLDKLLARSDRVYHPAHGPSVAAPQDHVRRLIAHRRGREAQILAELAAGEGRIEAIVPRLYAAVDPILYPAAGRSVLAHLIDLEARGRVERNDETWRLTP